MPRKLTGEMTPDTLEYECMFTLAMLRADPNTTQLSTKAEGWQAQIEQLRVNEQAFRQQEADADALRTIANQYLDATCVHFGDELLLACGKNRNSTRWQRFFTTAVSDFVRQNLSRQVALVQSWLSSGPDDVLDKYRAELEKWTQACESALQTVDTLMVRRRDNWAAREELATTLTRERDALHRTLAELRDALGLERRWPDIFFRQETRSKT